MTHKIFGKLGVGLVLAWLGLAGSAFGQNSLELVDGAIAGLGASTFRVEMTNDCDVEGYVLAIGYDTTIISVIDATTDGTAADTAGDEFVAIEFFDAQGGFTLGVVLDFNPPFDGQIIAPGAGQTIAFYDAMPDVIVAMNTPVDVTFEDGVFNNPPLDNVIVCQGQSIGAGQGLGFDNGVVTVFPPPDNELTIVSTSGPGDEQLCVPVTLTTQADVQGYVLAISHPGADLDLDSIDVGSAATAVGAEFSIADTNPLGGVGGTLGVVLDFNPPFDGQTIGPGSDLEIAVFKYTCLNVVKVLEGEPVPPPVCHDLTFIDGVLGDPPLSNVIVVGGLSLGATQGLGLNNGEACCETVINPAQDTCFGCGIQDENGMLTNPEGAPGEIVEICFFYKDPTDQLQGLSMALTFDCDLCCIQGSFSIEGTIAETLGAEFVAHSCDNDPNDGDGCELTIGILLDALPPFEAQMLPPTATFLPIGCIDFEIKATAPCNDTLDIVFTDDVNGGETTLVKNVAVINNQSIQGFETLDCGINVVLDPLFIRGDCNGDTKVDLADAAGILSQQFSGFEAPCLDACDANDDEKINLADTVYLLNFLFDSGDAPPAPGPDLDQGPDPDGDALDCEDGRDPCP